jgi:hypothetical protein
MSLGTLPLPSSRNTSPPGVLRHSAWDALLIGLAVLHGVLLLVAPLAPVIALGLWWNSNTIAHNFIHKPFFRSRLLNKLFALYLSALLGVPQTIWRGRHFAHHAGMRWRPRLNRQMVLEIAVVSALWGALLALHPRLFFTAYLPGYAAGLLLCSLHGYYEHVRGTVSHYGTLYNLLFFNDGYHAEHHARPGTHWTRLRHQVRPGAETSRWPAVLRWLEILSLDGLERCVLHAHWLQRFVLNRHDHAFRKLLPALPPRPRVAIVGGGLFPRTLLILQRLLPDARFVVIDRSAANLETARAFQIEGVELVNRLYEPTMVCDCDLVVFPLAYVGDRLAVYRCPPAPAVLVHDWIWQRRGASAIVSLFLLKRLNLVERGNALKTGN